MAIKITDKLTPDGSRFMRELNELKKLEVRAGIQNDNVDENGTRLVDIAAWNELGTEHIPSRPFMRDSVDKHIGEIKKLIRAELKAFSKGKTAKAILSELGNEQVSRIQTEITEGDFVPNSEATIKRKGSSRPLIDTGRMRSSIHYVIQKKGGD